VRVLIVGAGAIGGYFGGRLMQAGHDITFLVRPARARELAMAGLTIHSPHGDAHIERPPTVLAEAIDHTFDVILVSCKAYDLADAIRSFAAAVGPQSAIIPLLNGLQHFDSLDDQFGKERVLGGLCTISLTLNEKREVLQLHPMQSFVFGERDGGHSERARAIGRLIESAKFNGMVSESVMQDMWEKWVFLASLAASTCLMRSSVGSIVAAPGGRDFMVATAHGYSPTPAFLAQRVPLLTAAGSELTASMLRDIKAGLRVEADSVIGDLVTRGEMANEPVPLLRLAYTHVKSYEIESWRHASE
jgi:2-dehydropantoate 2-reductase